MRAGHLDDARTFLVESVDAIEDTPLSTLNPCFTLVAYAQLTLAEGDPRRAAMAVGAADELRKRAGLRAWPLTRRIEADLVTRVARQTDPATYKAAFAAGTELHPRDPSPSFVMATHATTANNEVNTSPGSGPGHFETKPAARV